MPLTFSRPNQTLAVTRINKLLGRVYSLTVLLVGLQMVINALNQIPHLNQFWLWISLGPMVASQLAFIYLVWVRGDEVHGYRAIILTTLFALSTWPLQIGDQILHPGEKPWFWWSLGISSLAAVGAFKLSQPLLFRFITLDGFFLKCFNHWCH